MINGRPRRIHLTKGVESRYEEGRAGAAITPGMLIALNNAGAYVPHAAADGAAQKAFALEDALQGKTIDNNYESGDLVRFIIAGPGDHILAILEAGANVADGALLSSNGAGYLQASAGNPVAVALEDRDASASDVTLEDRRIRVRML